MMRCNTFPRSVAFAALAAIGWLPWMMLSVPLVGVWNARALYLIAVLTLYVSGLAATPTTRLRVAVATGLAAAVVALAAGSTTELAIGLALALGVARSAFLYRTASGRAVVREVILLFAGLLLARFFTAASPASTGLALWGFLLVQSLFFLVPAVCEKPAPTSHPDPFEEAHRRALSILERTGI